MIQYDHQNAQHEFYKGSQKVEPSKQKEQEEGPDAVGMVDVNEESAVGAKGAGNPALNSFAGLWHLRIPKTRISIGMSIIAVFYVCVNLLCLMVTKERYSFRFASLLAANSFFVALPGTENSLKTH